MSGGPESRASGFSYEPRNGSGPGVDEPVTFVELRSHEHAGPFWSREEALSEDYEEWQPYGMTRSTFDACVRWNQAGGDEQAKRQLLSLLRHELRGVEVAAESE